MDFAFARNSVFGVVVAGLGLFPLFSRQFVHRRQSTLASRVEKNQDDNTVRINFVPFKDDRESRQDQPEDYGRITRSLAFSPCLSVSAPLFLSHAHIHTHTHTNRIRARNRNEVTSIHRLCRVHHKETLPLSSGCVSSHSFRPLGAESVYCPIVVVAPFESN